MKNKFKKVPLFKQKKNACGPTALRMVLAYFGEDVSEKEILKGIGGLAKSKKRPGVKTVKLSEFVRNLGFKTECLSYNKEFTKGKAKIKKPDKGDIVKYLKKGIPVILAVRSFLLYGDKPSDKGHFIVITNYKKGFFWFNDPYGPKRRRIKDEDLMFALHNNVLDSSAYFLAIWPKSLKKLV